MPRALVSFALLVLAACGSAVTQGVPYDPPNELPIGEPTDRSDEPDGGRVGDGGRIVDAGRDG